MKKKICLIILFAISIIISVLMIGCPTNIQPEEYTIYTINGVIMRNVDKTGIGNVLIEVRNYQIEVDKNIIISRGTKSRSDYSSSESDSSSGNGSSSESDSSSASDSSSSSESGEISSPDENIVLGSCRTAEDGKFSVTFKAYPSQSNEETFYIYATNDDEGENDETFASQVFQTVPFKDVNSSNGNPYGSYHKYSKTTSVTIYVN